MIELEVAINSINNSNTHPAEDFLAVLGDFEKQHSAKILCTVYDWEVAWAETMKIVLYKHGPVMSQVGSTWLGSLEATEGIRPFTFAEINQITGSSGYHPAAWQSGVSFETGKVTAIPWFLDTYALYYRRDVLRKAGIDEIHAFESLEALAETAQKLLAVGVTIPFAMPTSVSSRASLHNIAGWVWTHGGEFISEDGKRLLLSEPKTRQGLKAYFSHYHSMPKAAQTLTDAACYDLFLDGTAAITLRNSSLLHGIQRHPVFAESLENLGVAGMPGVNFVGGSSFVLWSHIRLAEERLALELLHLITSPEIQLAQFKQSGILPARLEALRMLEKEPLLEPLIKALMTGRSFRRLKLWGLIEDRLIAAISQIWQALYAKENPNLDEEISRVMDPLERRLQLTLSDS